MSQKKCVTIYGYSDDLVEIENSQYKEDEIDCYDKAIRFFFVDGTIISICYAQDGVWKITHEAIGKAWYELTRCEDDDDDAYSDVFKIDSEIISYEVFTPKAKSIQDIQEQNQEKSEKLIPNHKNTHTSRAKQVQKTSMQAALEEEREALSQTAQRNASRYSEAEDATKDFVVK